MSSPHAPDQGVPGGVSTPRPPAEDSIQDHPEVRPPTNKPWPLGKEPVIPLASKPAHEPEFPSRQALANFLFGTDVSELVVDGYGIEDMPPGDKEIRDAYAAVEAAVNEQIEAIMHFDSLLPESSHARRIREDKEADRRAP